MALYGGLVVTSGPLGGPSGHQWPSRGLVVTSGPLGGPCGHTGSLVVTSGPLGGPSNHTGGLVITLGAKIFNYIVIR